MFRYLHQIEGERARQGKARQDGSGEGARVIGGDRSDKGTA